jgi:hypothetical protein
MGSQFPSDRRLDETQNRSGALVKAEMCASVEAPDVETVVSEVMSELPRLTSRNRNLNARSLTTHYTDGCPADPERRQRT